MTRNKLSSWLRRLRRVFEVEEEEVIEIKSIEEAEEITRRIEEKYKAKGYSMEEVCGYAEDYVDPHLENIDYTEAFFDCHTYTAAKEYLEQTKKAKTPNHKHYFSNSS